MYRVFLFEPADIPDNDVLVLQSFSGTRTRVGRWIFDLGGRRDKEKVTRKKVQIIKIKRFIFTDYPEKH